MFGDSFGDLGSGEGFAPEVGDGMTLFAGQVFVFHLARVRF